MSTGQPQPPRVRTWVRDTASYIGGWGLIIHQVAFVPRGDFNLWVLGFAGVLIGVPGLGQLMPYVVRMLGRWLTEQSPPSPPPEGLQGPPPSSSSTTSGGSA